MAETVRLLKEILKILTLEPAETPVLRLPFRCFHCPSAGSVATPLCSVRSQLFKIVCFKVRKEHYPRPSTKFCRLQSLSSVDGSVWSTWFRCHARTKSLITLILQFVYYTQSAVKSGVHKIFSSFLFSLYVCVSRREKNKASILSA